MTQPWETLASAYVVQDAPYLTVRREDVRLPGDRTIDGYWIVEQPAWVNVVAVTGDDRLVLIRQWRHALGREGLEIPGGYKDDGETPLEGARRELLEETGYGGGEWAELLRIAPNPALLDNLCYCFAAYGVSRLAEPRPQRGSAGRAAPPFGGARADPERGDPPRAARGSPPGVRTGARRPLSAPLPCRARARPTARSATLVADGADPRDTPTRAAE